jgi:transcriptional regulator with XRE-family HTH domain
MGIYWDSELTDMSSWSNIHSTMSRKKPEEKKTSREETLRDLGRRIVRLREGKGWSQAELADRMGVPGSRLSKWERGLNAPAFEDLPLLADMLDVSLDEVIRGHKPLSRQQRLEIGLSWVTMTRLLRPFMDVPDE